MIPKPILWIIRTVRESIVEERCLWKIELELEIPSQTRYRQLGRTRKVILGDWLYLSIVLISSALLVAPVLIIATSALPVVLVLIMFGVVLLAVLVTVLTVTLILIRMAAHYQIKAQIKQGEL